MTKREKWIHERNEAAGTFVDEGVIIAGSWIIINFIYFIKNFEESTFKRVFKNDKF